MSRVRGISFEYLAWAAVFVILLIASGIFYVLVEHPPFSLGVQLVYPSASGQTVSETLIVFFLYVFALVGLYMIYNSAKYRHRSSVFYSSLLSGVLVVMVALLLLMFIYNNMK
ncbi:MULTISPECIES: hypothetical protein [Thermofilum]|jgi:hypothetical protein|uniref:Uncharacterized protein n=1 Tax=Thermofilum adornatum TaxID=1365176 RepID=S5ZDX6_9CREN|nr:MULTISPECIES: hypothetical protein [Thermofilum]AGT35258.1 hypothetical protein N186_04535 [Thermofilum adornatum]MCC5998925.1 hypothetical protein [Thermofilum sp.]MCI4409997.1 hypothetical protein [Thermofilum sp.]NAZ25243.1 hypothetical protein [Thermofilum sp.]